MNRCAGTYLFGNIYNKAYRSILGINIIMSNDGRICFIVVPDKKYGVLVKI